MVKDIPSDVPTFPYMVKGDRGKVVNIVGDGYHISNGKSVFEIFYSDVDEGYAISLSKQREDKLNTIGI